MKKITIIGLTGPIAAGKDTVARMLARHKAYIINADEIGHKILAPQSKAWHGAVKIFGSKILSRGGVVNRKKLGKIVFGDAKALKKLNAITHPEIKKSINDEIKKAKNKKIIVINAAIIKEMMLIPIVDKVISVIAKDPIRLNRLKRKGLSINEAKARMRMQAGNSAYRKMADIIIENNGTKAELKKVIQKLWANLN
jgi:dephospho-CoA kinase